MYTEDDFIALSAIQHYIFCPRQCALIHIEDAWRENVLTAKGRRLHERVDSGDDERRFDVRFVRALRIHSYEYGLAGKADMVEFHENGDVIPIEYKRGKPKQDASDTAQLAAQAMCLEEMMHTKIAYGYLYYGRLRRRIRVEIDDALRETTTTVIARIHEMVREKHTPQAKYMKKCKRCSLFDVCMPKAISSRKVNAYIKELYQQ